MIVPRNVRVANQRQLRIFACIPMRLRCPESMRKRRAHAEEKSIGRQQMITARRRRAVNVADARLAGRQRAAELAKKKAALGRRGDAGSSSLELTAQHAT